MTEEELVKRRSELEGGADLIKSQIQQLEQAVAQRRADLQATVGAIMECQFWLDQIKSKKEP